MPTEPTPISALPTPPTRTMTAATFVATMNAWFAGWPIWRTQANSLADVTYDNAVEAAAGAVAAVAAEAVATAASTAAVGVTTYVATSATSLSLSLAAKAITLAETARTFANGQRVSLVRLADRSVRGSGIVSLADMTAKTMTVTLDTISAAVGPYSDWLVVLTALEAMAPASGAQVAALASEVVGVTPDSLGDALVFVDGGTGSGTYAPDHAAGPNHKRIADGNSTLSNLTAPKEGKGFYIRLKQDATGSRTWSFGTGYKFAGGAPEPSTAANAVDAVSGVVVDAATPLYDCVFLRGIG